MGLKVCLCDVVWCGGVHLFLFLVIVPTDRWTCFRPLILSIPICMILFLPSPLEIPLMCLSETREMRMRLLPLGRTAMKVLKLTSPVIPFLQTWFGLMLVATRLTWCPVVLVVVWPIEVTTMALLLPTLTAALALLATEWTAVLFPLTILWTPLGRTPTASRCGVHLSTLECGVVRFPVTLLRTRRWLRPVRLSVACTTLLATLLTPTLTRSVAMLLVEFVIPKLTLLRRLLLLRTLESIMHLLFLPTRFTVTFDMVVPIGMFVLTSVSEEL